MSRKRKSESILSYFGKKTICEEDPSDIVEKAFTEKDPDITKQLPESEMQIQISNSSVGENDIGLYIASDNISDFKKESLLKNPWIPSESHKFYEQILGNKRRTFQQSWMKRFTWLVYSDAANGALCKVCVLFANKSGVGKGNHQNAQCLVKRAFQNWKGALEAFENHEKTKYHRDSLILADNFLKVSDGRKEGIYYRLNQDASKLVKKNRDILAAVIQTILLCGRQEIALRGTDDSGRICLEEPSCNDGNFRSLVRYRAKFGDKILADHINSSGSNELYSSPIVQNELITLIGEDIKTQIIQRVLKANFFSVLADGTTDIRRTEQFSLCIRYVDRGDEFKIREDFIEFVPVFDASGEALANLIKSHIQSMGLNLSQLRGQGYDGASAMKGHFRGVQACILKDYPKAIYTHCAAHCLNLCLADASKVQTVRNVFGTISEICNFFRSSSKRANILKMELESLVKPTVSCLKKYCETRWVERHEAVAIFAHAFSQIIEALEKIIVKGESDDTAKASSLHKNICSFNFIIGLSVCKKILGLTHNLSEYLQGKYVDLNIAIERVDLIIEKVSSMRENAEEEFKELYETSMKIASSFGIQPHLPRRVGSQKYRENYSTNCEEDYYRQSIFIPYLDEIKSSLEQRFIRHKQEIVALHHIMPLNSLEASFEDIRPAFDFYLDDLKNKQYSILEGEWDLWKLKWKRVSNENPKSIPKYAIDALKECSNDIFPNIEVMLEVLAVLPVSTASVERSFSTLKRLKTYLRNSTGNDRLTGLALMTIHRDVKINEKSVIDKFAITPRRKKFI